ncbi:MAG TPA: hypothetical protein VMH37_11345 [Candidatus Binataceae bacterium]|nr:hypothetical protein [Candidatus Binataceae bacterium]
MPPKKKTAPKRKPAAKRKAKPVASPSQLDQLRSMVSQLRKRIEDEARARKLNTRLIEEARRARDEVMRHITTLRDQGKSLAEQLRSTLTDAKKREKARQDAMAAVADLREELMRRTDEVRQKTLELRNLAEESALKARDVIMGTSRESTPSGGKKEGD